ncbi:uncharacterized protein A4U43_C03F29910 [Asparagus officinalis]|uniref:Uncharacterized protein n=1 Tax=Asparagus officinalis TaxID=4686 RepID=A0A5P1FES0_ASPOF|nr:WAS/WASL-interacting protein family member 3 [Asparagus officinalis]ONK76592.1 uncharacterized protein A4U43_C03F29910 [Asparagus officinalis]
MGKSKKQSRAKSTPPPSSSMASSASPAPPPPPPPLPPSAAKKSFLRRALPFLLPANLAVGVYVLARTWKKEPSEKDEESKEKIPSSQVTSKESAISEKTTSTSIPSSMVTRAPIPEHEQRELYKWVLEERRKVKPRDSAEKKKIDEEKALLKKFIRAESLPSL